MSLLKWLCERNNATYCADKAKPKKGKLYDKYDVDFNGNIKVSHN